MFRAVSLTIPSGKSTHRTGVERLAFFVCGYAQPGTSNCKGKRQCASRLVVSCLGIVEIHSGWWRGALRGFPNLGPLTHTRRPSPPGKLSELLHFGSPGPMV